MNVFKYFRGEIAKALDELAAAGEMPAGLDADKMTAEPPREAAHGDVTTNAAMVLAKAAGQKPRDLADRIAARLRRHPRSPASRWPDRASSTFGCPTTSGARGCARC